MPLLLYHWISVSANIYVLKEIFFTKRLIISYKNFNVKMKSWGYIISSNHRFGNNKCIELLKCGIRVCNIVTMNKICRDPT